MSKNHQKGHVEIFNVYDSRYFNIFVDGVAATEVYKAYFTKEVFRSKTRKAWAKMAGVPSDELTYTLYNLYEIEEKNLAPHYDSNDYGEYSDAIKAVQQYNLKPEFFQKDLEYIEDKY